MAGSSLWQSIIRSGDGTKLFLRIKHYKSYLLWVIIDVWWVPPSFFILYCDMLWAFRSFKEGNLGAARILNSFWLDTDKKSFPMMPWAQDTASILSIFYWFFIQLIVYWFDSYRTSEVGPSTLSSLGGNFPCMPQSPTFTHSPEGLDRQDSLLLNANTISPNVSSNLYHWGAEYTARGHFCPHCRALNFNEPYMPPLGPHFSHKSKIQDLRLSLFAFFA